VDRLGGVEEAWMALHSPRWRPGGLASRIAWRRPTSQQQDSTLLSSCGIAVEDPAVDVSGGVGQ